MMNSHPFFYKLLMTIESRLTRTFAIRTRSQRQDNFDWRLYHIHYRGELQRLCEGFAQRLAAHDYIMEGDLLNQRHAHLPLHPNHKLLYETIVLLKPNSLMEVGCGAGDHLHNLKKLLPDTTLYGCDV